MQPFMGRFGVVAILLPKCPNPAVYGTAARLARATLRAWVALRQPTSIASAWSSCAGCQHQVRQELVVGAASHDLVEIVEPLEFRAHREGQTADGHVLALARDPGAEVGGSPAAGRA